MNESLARAITDGTPRSVMERYSRFVDDAAQADFGEFDENIVVIDTETTGFSFHHDELIQIAAARMDRGEIIEWFTTFVNPGKPIPDDITHLTSITDDNVKDAPSPDEALSQLVAFVGNSKIVAHNVGFDRTFVTKHPAGYPLLDNLWIDSLDLARIALPRMKSHRLIDLVKAFGAPLSTHRADDDVASTCALFRILLAAVQAMPEQLIKIISTMATNEEWSTGEVFRFFAKKTPDWENEEEIKRRFSLKTLRTNRIKDTTYSSKSDAEVLAEDPMQALTFPSQEAIDQAFAPDGLLGCLYGDYETRHEQLAMARGVRNAFASSENLAVEAGTGVGKSMAYLVPASLTALANNITIGVATKTNALLDQLVFHELPLLIGGLQKLTGKKLTVASLKGFSHYPCLLRVERLVNDGPTMRTINKEVLSQAPSLAALLSFIEQSEYDDMDTLKIDYRVLSRRMITTTSHECLRRKCPYFGQLCFVHGSRRRAEQSHIVVTNHSLLFCDIAAEGGLLPPIRYWVVDEAHGAEKEARNAFSLELSAEELKRLIQRVSSQQTTTSRNIFSRAERIAVPTVEGEGETLFYALTHKAKTSGNDFAEAASEFIAHLKDLLFFVEKGKSKSYETVDLWINDDVRDSYSFGNLASLGKVMYERAEKLTGTCQELVGYLESLEDLPGVAAIQREIAACAMDLKDVMRACEVILFSPSDAYVYAATLCRKKDKQEDILKAMLYNVGGMLNETFYTTTHSVVFSSATMTVNDSFTAFEESLGLNTTEYSRCATLKLDSSYDFDRHMTIYVVNDMPEPNNPRYLEALQQLLIDLHRAQKGSMLTLFTNRREMETCFDQVKPVLKEDDLRLVCQKWGVSVKGLRDEFLTDEHLSLFALKSFWEGFDAPGSTLRGVVIPKLPFAKPSDPLSCERSTRDDQAWRRYVLPAAILETKQAAGRLIRKADDEGILVLADKRLLTKSYGKSFLRSMPSHTVKVMNSAEIIKELAHRNEDDR